MAGRKTLAITDRQFAVLHILWDHGPLTVRELLDHLPQGDRLPYTTVLGLLQNMEKAGLVTHDKENLSHRYRPTVAKREATGNLLADFLRRFFGGSAANLVMGLVDAEQLSAEELRAIEERLRAGENPGKPPRGKGKP
jgi:predicted transcriptional regulator